MKRVRVWLIRVIMRIKRFWVISKQFKIKQSKVIIQLIIRELIQLIIRELIQLKILIIRELIQLKILIIRELITFKIRRGVVILIKHLSLLIFLLHHIQFWQLI